MLIQVVVEVRGRRTKERERGFDPGNERRKKEDKGQKWKQKCGEGREAYAEYLRRTQGIGPLVLLGNFSTTSDPTTSGAT